MSERPNGCLNAHGENVSQGYGWVIKLPGLALAPFVTRKARSFCVDAKFELRCGYPMTAGELWDSADYEGRAMLWNGNPLLESAKLNFVVAPGHFAGAIDLPETGRYRLTLFAQNMRTGNSGFVVGKLD